MYDALARFITRYRRWLVGTLVACSAICALTYPSLEFDFSPQQFFRTDSELGTFREDFAQTFAREDNLMLVAVDGGDVYEPAILSTIRNLTLDLRDFESVDRADSVATFQIPRAGRSEGELSVDPLLDQRIRRRDGSAVPIDDERAAQLRALAEDEPLVHGRLVSETGDAAAILLWIDRDIQSVQRLESILHQIRNRLDRHPLPEGFEYRLGGVPPLRVDIVGSLRAEQAFFIPINSLIFVLVLWFVFRRISGVVLPMAVVFMAVSGTVAMLVLTGSSINIVSNVLPTLIFVIGIADSIHMVTRHAEEIDAGSGPIEAARETIRHTGFACLLTTTTTAVGFVSLITADTALLSNFGWQAAGGVMLAYFFTLFFLPAALAAIDSPPSTGRSDPGPSVTLIRRALTATADWVLERPRRVVAAGLTVALGFGGAAYQWVEIDEKLMSVFERGHPAYRDVRLMEQKFGGFLPMEISISSTERGRMKDPAVYRRLDRFQSWATEQPEVLSSQSIVDFHQSARAALLGDPDARDEMPTSSAQVEQLHTLIAGGPDATDGPDQFVTRDFRRARVLLRVRDVGAKGQLALADRARSRLDSLFEEIPKVDFRITGDAYAASVALTSFVYDLFYSLLYASVVIFFMMALIFRSLRVGLVSMIPNTMPLVITFGYMGMTGINLNSTTVIIFAIGLGLAVDDTIHVLARFREEIEGDHSIRRALVRTYDSAGRAILFTSLLLLLGMGVLLFSDFVPTRQFGSLIAITIGGAILGDLVVLPPMLYLIFDESENEE